MRAAIAHHAGFDGNARRSPITKPSIALAPNPVRLPRLSRPAVELVRVGWQDSDAAPDVVAVEIGWWRWDAIAGI